MAMPHGFQFKNIPKTSLIAFYEKQLKQLPLVVLDTLDPHNHISAFIAWQNVGGNIFVLNPNNDFNTKIVLNLKAINKALNLKNKIMLHTTGTTGDPKIVVQGKKQINDAVKRQEISFEADYDTWFLNLMPVYSAGFWLLAMPGLFARNSGLIFGTKDNLKESFSSGANTVLIAPTVFSALIKKDIQLDLTPFRMVLTGSSRLEQIHVQYAFNNGASKFNHIYGSTEAGVPILQRKSTCADETATGLDFKPLAHHTKFKLSKENELLISGDSLCDNYEELESDGGFFCTGDVFVNNGNLLQFKKRLKDEKSSSCGKYQII
jgi:acyl-coenzyme A synthetase/AMP-(fatty) acid ligase